MSKQIVIAGDSVDTLLFSLSGAKTFKINNANELEYIYTYCYENKDKIAGIAINSKFSDETNKYYQKLHMLDIPMVVLPDIETGEIDMSLDRLTEKTLGRKLSN